MAPASMPNCICRRPSVAGTPSTDSILNASGSEPYLSCRDRVAGDHLLDGRRGHHRVVEHDRDLLLGPVVVRLFGQGGPPVLPAALELQADEPAALLDVVVEAGVAHVLADDLRLVELVLDPAAVVLAARDDLLAHLV